MILKVKPQFLPQADCPDPPGDGEGGRLGLGGLGMVHEKRMVKIDKK